jgi:hypothetical protein
MWPARGGLATLLEQGVAMTRTMKEITRLDRRWFRARPERRHRCRWPDTRGSPFAIAIVASVRSSRSAISGAAASSIGLSFFRARCPRMRSRPRRCLRSQRHPASQFLSSPKWTSCDCNAACARRWFTPLFPAACSPPRRAASATGSRCAHRTPARGRAASDLGWATGRRPGCKPARHVIGAAGIVAGALLLRLHNLEQ